MSKTPKYTKEFTAKVLEATDIVKVIGAHTPLRERNGLYYGPSLFTKSGPGLMVVYPDKQFFKDYSCNQSGNVFLYLAHKEHLTFDQVVEKLAKEAHIPITEADLYKDPQATTKKNLYAIMDAAATFYHNQMKAAGGEVARDYVTERGLEDATTKQFKLGFSPGTGQALYNYLQHQGFSHETMIQSGLIKVADGKPYDYFRNRLMFPIWDREGRVVAFTGRRLGADDAKSGPKYVNSSASIIFNKSEILYGMNFAKNTQTPYYVLVEGQMDVIKLHQAGFTNVVAISGTAFTEKHCQQLLTRVFKGREVPQQGLMIATDGDSAGRDAKLKIIRKGSEFLPFGMRVVQWPEDCKDPDELIAKYGKQFFMDCLKCSTPADNYLICALMDKEQGDMKKVSAEFVKIFVFKEQRGMGTKELDERMSAVVNSLPEYQREL